MNTKQTLLAYHNDNAVRQKYLARVELHRQHDQIVKGRYWEDGKGCAVGCILHSAKHSAAETELGIPAWLMRLIDGIFENLPNAEAVNFPGAFLEAIPVGADLAPVRDQFLAWLMEDATYGLTHTARDDEIKAIAAEVGRRLRTGEGVTGAQADELTERLRDAWDARDAWAAWNAWVARDARAAWDARAAFVIASRDELLRLLRGCSVANPGETK